MRIVREKRQIAAVCKEWRRREAQVVGFVPTMGNLHDGHLTLVRYAQERSDRVVVSVFVNPLQFDNPDDLQKYPRTLDDDARLLAEVGVDVLFCPDLAEMYPATPGPQALVMVPALATILEGASRPGHFDGVATVVAKLFNLIQPNLAVFGEKDFQQLRVIESMVSALNFPVSIEAVATVRDRDGLALSSRNSRLSAAARQRAPLLFQVLEQTAALCLAAGKNRSPVEDRADLLGCFERAAASGLEQLRSAGFKPDYLTLRRTADLAEAEPDDHDLVILVAAWLDEVRLIDNLRLNYTAFATSS